MNIINDYLQSLVTRNASELHLEPNKNPFVSSSSGNTDIENSPIAGAQISMLVFPLIPSETKMELPTKSEVEFTFNHNLGEFRFLVKKTPSGFSVSVKPLSVRTETHIYSAEEYKLKNEAENKLNDSNSETAVPNRFANNFAQTKPAEVAAAPLTESVSNFSVNPPNQNLSNSFSAPQESVAQAKTDSGTSIPDFLQQNVEKKSESTDQSLDISDSFIAKALIHYETGQIASAGIDPLFHKMAEVGASDLHLSVMMPPMVRKDGKMQELETNQKALTAEKLDQLLFEIMPERNLKEFKETHDTDFAYEIEGLARFRSNIFMDRKGMGAVFRIIPSKILTAEQLGLSEHILNLCTLSKGLVVVTGPTGSGKSTTLCAMVDHINLTRDEHLITIEDPIEFVHQNKRCLVNQREIHTHTDSFKHALRAALREDPDIVLVGEMRDLETIAIAIETAETGHLVFGTLHTSTAPSTVDRIIDQFPTDRQQQIRVMLSESLKGVIAQTLLPKIGGGRIAALETLIVTPAVSNLIREGKTFQIPSAMQTGKVHGMGLLNDSLLDLVKKNLVEPRDAYIKAVDKVGLEDLYRRNGIKM